VSGRRCRADRRRGLAMWNMRKRHFSHSCKTAAAKPSVKAARS
jgi:hypothetical protein